MMKRLGKGDEALAKLLTPTLHVEKNSPPSLLLFGKEDRLLVQAEEFVKRSKEVGARAEMYLADGVGHGFFNRSPWRERTLRRVDEFLQSLDYVQGKPTIIVP
jgi:acetyl esterase/lipase